MKKLLMVAPHMALLMLLGVAAGSPATAQRQGPELTIATIEPTLPSAQSAAGTLATVPRMPVSDPRVQRVRTDVKITVDGGQRVARVEVEEQFRNNSGRLLEGDYLYPVPAGAVFTDFSLFMGEQELKGEMLPAETARGIYEEIVRRKKDPALIELVGHGLLRARVFPIAAGETRRVILRYTLVLGRDGHLLRLRYPRVVGLFDAGDRPAPERTAQIPVHPHIRPPAPPPFHMLINVTDAARFATPYSPTHRIEVRERDDELEIAYDGSGESPRDFELFLPLREEAVGVSVVTHAPAGEPGFYMMLFSPPAVTAEAGIPRDLTLVLDVSGSMAGDKIVQARAALDQMLAGLERGDRFRVIAFSSVVRQFRNDFAPAQRDEVAAARAWLAGVEADGSTNIQAALREALRPATRAGRMAQIVFLTDGKPTVGETSVEHIVELAGSMIDDERLFAFGVGHDVNTYLLDTLADSGRGTVSYVAPGEDVEEAVSSLTRKIRHPVLADIRVVEAPVMLEDFYPQNHPDLFSGEDLVTYGRYRGSGRGELVIEGTRAGRVERHSFAVEFHEHEAGNRFIPKLWAARKAGVLTTQVRLHGADPELVEEIRQLGLRYGILTDYTAYLVEEPGMSLDDATLRQVMDRARQMRVDADWQVGRAAFERARRAAEAKQAGSWQEAERALAPRPSATPSRPGEPRGNELAGGHDTLGVAEGATRHVVDRVFVMRGGVWTDLRFGAERVVRVAPFSAAYFELAERLPQLKPFLALGQRVIIAADGLAVELAESGMRDWSGGEIDAVVRAFGS